jgi:hypothetical protein
MSLRGILGAAAAIGKGVSSWAGSEQGKAAAHTAKTVMAYRNKTANPNDPHAEAELKDSIKELGTHVLVPAAKGITTAVVNELRKNRGGRF